MSPALDANFRSFQIISLIAFPKPQIFIFSPVQKACCDNIAVALWHRRHSVKTLKTNAAEGLTVHGRCTEGNEEETDCHSRIHEEHNSQSTIEVKLCYGMEIGSWWNQTLMGCFFLQRGVCPFPQKVVSVVGIQRRKTSLLVCTFVTAPNRWQREPQWPLPPTTYTHSTEKKRIHFKCRSRL